MTISADALRPGLQAFAREQAPVMTRLRRALEILYRDRAGGRTIDEIAEIVLLSVARAHEQRTQAALDRINHSIGRILADVETSRGVGAGPAVLRDRALRESDLKAIANAVEDLMTFEDEVKRRIAAHDESLGRAVDEALVPPGRAPVGSLTKALGRGEEIVQLSEAVLEAWRSGHTLPERSVAYAVPNPAEPQLVAAMRRLEDAVTAFRRDPRADAQAAAAAANALQREYAAANEALRRAAGDFDALITGDVLPGRPLPPGAPPRVGPSAAVAARADAVRARLAAAPTLVRDLPRPQLLDELRLSDLDVLAEGALREPVARAGLERVLLSPGQIRALRTAPPGLAVRLARLVEGWQRAHLIGPGFGSELIEGIMLAPEGVNQLVQNKGFEQILRAAHGAGADVPLIVRAKGRRLAVPLRDGTTEIVDILDSVQYRVPREGRPPVVFDITVHPDGTWSADHHGTLDGLWDPTVPLAGAR
ncbi:polymorphic toxin type 4 domain-containing protein [Raineyella sp. LH-20]|uniref:polymorphic toxin type 4 domain-containing protein n=1 Tax=Raineyella sp. LH-20 TaxID=3081204 RepID=UPI00295354B5|nr:polymorphic toxin type 4 domain-containing protein [Raineyella sp. LH-20]WOP18910.1 polymorphic toxin type 4 domain-containing protein [Raineyella sp. LH-20]